MNLWKLTKANCFDSDSTMIVELSKETAVQLITDLIQELSKTGIEKLILKSSEDEYLIFKIRD